MNNNNIEASNEIIHKTEYSQIKNVEDEFQVENSQKSNSFTVSKLMSLVSSNLNRSLILKIQDIIYQDKVKITNNCILVGIMLINIKSKNFEIESQEQYSQDKMKIFKKQAMDWRRDQNKKLPPHVWTLIEMAFYQLFDRDNQKNKSSIIITGPSGSGKTFTTKKIIEYLVSFDQQNETETQILKKTSLSEKINNILFIQESFGNAQTQQNPNSSRFGNNIQIFYSNQQKLVSGRIQTNQFERARVVTFNELEKNFHVFYYLVAAYERRNQLKDYLQKLDDEDQLDQDLSDQKNSIVQFLESLQLPTECYLLGKQFIGDYDHLRFIDLLNHFFKLEFEGEDIFDIFRCVAGLILLKQGNIYLASQMLKIQSLEEALGQFSESEINMIKSVRNAESPIDGFIIDIYHNLFNWIELKINEHLQSENKIDTKNHKQLNIYDSFGFESISDPKTLEHQNSLQQLLLNYINEKLQFFIQQQLQQKEKVMFEEEGVQFEDIQFESNENIIKFFEHKFIPFIKDQTQLKRSDQHLYDIIAKEQNAFQKVLIITDNLQKSTIGTLSEIRKIHRTSKRMFGIQHTNGEIFYKVDGMMKNNLIGIDQKLRELQNESGNSVIKQFKVIHLNKTLLELTSEQLEQLFSNFSQSETFFVKCVINQNQETDPLELDILAYIQYFTNNYQYKVKLEKFLEYYYQIFPQLQIQGNQTSINEIQKEQLQQQLPDVKIGKNFIFLKNDEKQKLDLLDSHQHQVQYEKSFLNCVESNIGKQGLGEERDCENCQNLTKKIRDLENQIYNQENKIQQLEEQLRYKNLQNQHTFDPRGYEPKKDRKFGDI